MAATFKDFMIECEMYPYSREHFELLKECSELELTDRFLRNQEIVREFYQENCDATFGLTEEFFHESTDMNSLMVLEESIAKKFKKIQKNIWHGIRRILRTFGLFCKKTATKFSDTTKSAQKIREKLEDIKFTEDDIQELVNNIKQIHVNNGRDEFHVGTPQPYEKHLKLKGVGNDTNGKYLRGALAAALSDSTVKAYVAHLEQKATGIGPIPAKDLSDAIESFAKKGKGNIDSCISNIKSTWKDAKQYGLLVNVASKDLTDIGDKLEKLANQFADRTKKELWESTEEEYDGYEPFEEFKFGLKGHDEIEVNVDRPLNALRGARDKVKGVFKGKEEDTPDYLKPPGEEHANVSPKPPAGSKPAEAPKASSKPAESPKVSSKPAEAKKKPAALAKPQFNPKNAGAVDYSHSPSGDANSAAPVNAEEGKAAAQAYADIQSVIATTMKLYSNLENYRVAVINLMKDFVKMKTTEKKEKKKNKDNDDT